MNEREQLEQAITALEAQRALLGDAVVNTALAPLREKLTALQAAAHRPAESEQRKQVTVLFADVSGFTAMSEKMDAEEVSATMNALWLRLDQAILDRGGRIDKHIGDAVMALFGAPRAQEDDPERAIRSALAMQAELSAFNEANRLPALLRMRIGLNTGPVLLGTVGTTGEYTAMGDAVNLASRLEHAAPVGGILISHNTYRHVRGVFDVQPLEPISVKGKAEPIQVYVVNRARPRAFRLTTRGVEGIETRTIGREAELARMKAALWAAQEHRRTHLINLVAEAGTGKSRLLYEFSKWLELLPERPLLLRGRATQEMTHSPYALFRDVLAQQFGIQDSDRAAVAREKLERGVAEFMGGDSAEKAHFIGHLIGFDFSASPHLQGILADARQIRDRAFYYAALLFAEVARTPTVLMLEDIHWADDGSLDLINSVMHERLDRPLLVICATRPALFEQRSTWGEGPMAHIRLDLWPLSDSQSRELVADILRKLPEIPSALQDLIVSRAEGSPFYVEELIKMLIEDGVIVTGEDQWRVKMEQLAAVRVPATLTGVLQARLDGLPALERETLQQASVVGRVFWETVIERLQEAAPEAPAPIHQRLEGLCVKELIFRREGSAFRGTEEYIFKHAILHDVTYESVLKRLRRTYHAQAAAALIELAGERANEYAGRIGEHFERAGEGAKAVEWYGRAGKQAQDTYAPQAAISYYRRALNFWRETADPQSRPPQPFEVYAGLGHTLVTQANYTEAIEIFSEMRAEAEAVSDVVALARAWYGLALAQGYQGDHRTALENAGHAAEVARSAGARAELVMALWMKGRSLVYLGDAEAALALGEQMLALASELGDRRQIGRNLKLLGGVNNMLGRYGQAEAYFTQALAIFEALDDRRQLMDLYNNLGVIATVRGDHPRAFGRYQQALDTARKIGDRDGEMWFLSNLGATRIELGQFDVAEADLRRVIEMAGSAGSAILADTHRYLAEACLGQDKLADALAAAQRALALGQESGAQEYIGAAWRALGLVAARLTEPILIEKATSGERQAYEAAACFAQSLRIYVETGMEGERAHTLQTWARYELEHGDRQRGAAMWHEARELFARLGVELEVQRMTEMPAGPAVDAG